MSTSSPRKNPSSCEAWAARTERLAQTGSWRWNVGEAQVQCSAELLRILGLGGRRGSLTVRALLRRLHPDDRRAVSRLVRATQDSPEPFSFDHRIVRPDGVQRRLESHAQWERDGAGRVRSLVGTSRDVTERYATEVSLLRGWTEWTYAMDFVEDPMYLLDMQERVVRANRAFYQFVGRAPEQVIGQEIRALMHPQGEPVPCPICAARQARQDAYITMEADAPYNPTGRPFEAMLRMIRNAAGQPIGMLMGIHDLSRTQETDKELRRLNRDIRLLLESAGEGIYGTDRDGRFTFINHAALELLGYTREEVAGRAAHPLIHHTRADGSPYPEVECPMYQAYQRGERTFADDEVLWRKDGAAVPVQYSAYPILEGERILGAVVVFRDIAEARAMRLKMDYLATHDALTGLVNRGEFERRLEAALQALREGTGPSASHVLCYLDLDQFKVVNDTCGHRAGDELLRQLSALLHTRLRDSDTLGRLGGDEFGVLLAGMGLREALPVVQDLRETVQEFRFVWEDKLFSLGVSIGVVPLTGQTESLASALSAADTACYIAKDSGRNRIHVQRPKDAELARRRGEMQWISRIHEALAGDKFQLSYQTIMSLSLDRTEPGECYETLLSMRDLRGRQVPPGAFLPAAERFNLMPAIDRWVVDRTLRWFAGHRQLLDRLALCTVNLSASSLGDDSFLEFVIERFGATQMPARKFCFEITENAAIANLTRALHFINELSALGCRFALDDFGSGMSSFAYLKNLPVDFLKIDGNFVRGIVGDPVDRAMVEAIHQVGHVMGIRTIAEHVETPEVLDVLRQIGVDYAQGFGISAPHPLERLV